MLMDQHTRRLLMIICNFLPHNHLYERLELVFCIYVITPCRLFHASGDFPLYILLNPNYQYSKTLSPARMIKHKWRQCWACGAQKI